MTSSWLPKDQCASSNLALSHRRCQGSVEVCAFTRRQLTSFRPATATVPKEDFVLKTFAVLGWKPELLEEVVRELALEAADNILSKHGKELECAAEGMLVKGTLGSLDSGAPLTAHFRRWQ